VQNKFVRLLNSRSRIARDDKIDIGDAGAGAAVASEKRDCFQFSLVRFFERASDILRLAAGRDRDQDIVVLSESPDLSRENFIESVIVSCGSDETSALRQVESGIRPSIFCESARELGAKVGGVRRAAAVATGKNFVATR
jgi:hypothetical protein